MTFEIENIPNEEAIKRSQEFYAYAESVRVKHQSLYDQLSFYDKELSDIHHALENLSLSASTCARICKEMRMILKKRRAIKEEVLVIDAIYGKIKDIKPDVNMNKKYDTRTHVLDKYFKENS